MSDSEAAPTVGPTTVELIGGEAPPVPRPRVDRPEVAAADRSICAVELPEFEGPLDLLLHLVRRHELEILDIPISFVCEKYLEYIEFMRAMDLEVAGDYLVMAATLAYLKSRELVPTSAVVEEESALEDGPDPRDELIRRLLEYQTYRDAAHRLDALPVSGRDTFARGLDVELPPVDAGLAPITLFRLAEAYHRVLEKARILKSHEVVLETVSVAARMQQLTLLLVERERFDFEEIFLERAWSSEAELRGVLVVTLMSILELVRLGVARVHQPIGTDVLHVERRASAEDAARAMAGYDETESFGAPPSSAPAGGEDAPDALHGPDPRTRIAGRAVHEVQGSADDPLSSDVVIAQDAGDVPANPTADWPEDPPDRDDPPTDG